MEESISLSELTAKIGQSIKRTLPQDYWIVAEISEIQVNRNGHCYLNLIEKPEEEKNPTAEMRATIWSNQYKLISKYFEEETGCQLEPGMKIMVLVTVEFHDVYGISLNISDINPTYTIGEDEQHRLKILRQLEEEGMIDMNKEIGLPTVIQRIAIISSLTAAGYQDFMQQLTFNQYGIAFHTKLFQASMQGEQTEASIVKQLEKIYKEINNFDVVIIIRGGGSRADLRWFDNYNIAANIAQFPIPVITGIGHDKDQSIADIVANTSLKTPTAVAEFIIDICGNFVADIENIEEQLANLYEDFLEGEQSKLKEMSKALLQAFQIVHIKTNNELENFQQRLSHKIEFRIANEQAKLNLLNATISAKDPQTILKQGFTLSTDSNGSILRSTKQVKKHSIITTHFSDGTIQSTVN